MLGGWKEMCVRRVIQEMKLHLAHQEVTFSEKASNQKTKLLMCKHTRARTLTHTRTQVPHKTGRRVERSCFQEAVIKSEKEYSKYYFNF